MVWLPPACGGGRRAQRRMPTQRPNTQGSPRLINGNQQRPGNHTHRFNAKRYANEVKDHSGVIHGVRLPPLDLLRSGLLAFSLGLLTIIEIICSMVSLPLGIEVFLLIQAKKNMGLQGQLREPFCPVGETKLARNSRTSPGVLCRSVKRENRFSLAFSMALRSDTMSFAAQILGTPRKQSIPLVLSTSVNSGAVNFL